jgi:hypothetical protein
MFDPRYNARANALLAKGASFAKLTDALNKEFNLSLSSNALSGFVHANKGEIDGRTWLIEFLKTGKAPFQPEPGQVQTRSEKSPGSLSESEPTPVDFNYDEYLADSMRTTRSTPGNGPLRLKAPVKPVVEGKRRRRRTVEDGVGRFTGSDRGFDIETEFFEDRTALEVEDDAIPTRRGAQDPKEMAARFLRFRARKEKE